MRGAHLGAPAHLELRSSRVVRGSSALVEHRGISSPDQLSGAQNTIRRAPGASPNPGLFGGNRQVPPRSSTSLHRYTNPRQYTGSAFQWLVESRSGMRYKRVCEVEFCFKKVYSDSKTCNRARAARSLVFLAYVGPNCRVVVYIALFYISKFSVLPPQLRRALSPSWCSSSP